MEKFKIRLSGDEASSKTEIIRDSLKSDTKKHTKSNTEEIQMPYTRESEITDEEEPEESGEQRYGNKKDENKNRLSKINTSKHKKIKTCIGVIAFAGIIIFGFFLVTMLKKYTTYSVTETWNVKNASASFYADFGGCVLKYNNDGAILNDERGNVLWNEGYEMSRPKIDINGEYLIIYDKGGTGIYIMTRTGEESIVKTNAPISSAEVSGTGTVAVVSTTEDKTTSSIQMYGKKGEIIASGEMHLEKGGYPTDIALSHNGELLMVSAVGFEKGKLRSTIYFYNFGNAGKDAIDNIVASYSYSGTLIPEVEITDNGGMLAIGTDKIILYDGQSSPKERKIIKTGSEIKSIVHNNRYFGYIISKRDEDGKVADVLEVYNFHGFRRFSRKIDMEYRKIKFLNDNEVVLNNGNEIKIINLFGMEKLHIDSDDEEIYDVLSKKAGREYYFVRADKIEQVKLQ